MKRWIKVLAEQLDLEWSRQAGAGDQSAELSEERATLLFMIDLYNKNLIDFEGHPVRRIRETLDLFAKEILAAEASQLTDILFRFRQFFSSYRVAEYTYMQKTFDDFRAIIWEFVDQLSEDLSDERKEDLQVKASLENLREAVESQSIDLLKTQSRQFIDVYVQTQSKKDKRRAKRMESVRKNLDLVKQQLDAANNGLRTDPLTGAVNRRGFEEHCKHCLKLMEMENLTSIAITVDIDHFKKINDSYGHDTGDFILKALVRILKDVFHRPEDVVARLGGEEFVILLPASQIDYALKKAEMAMMKIRSEVFVMDAAKIKMTVSMGIARLLDTETVEVWLKRADRALYHSKNSGRNKISLAQEADPKTEEVA